MRLLWFCLLLATAVGMSQAYPVWPDTDELDSDLQTELGKYFREILEHLLEQLQDKLGENEELRLKVKDVITKLHDLGFGDKVREQFNKLTGNLREWFKNILDELERKNHNERKSFGDAWRKVKDYFRNLGLNIREGLTKFGQWVKEHTGSSLENAKSHLDRLKTIAEEYKKNVRFLRKEIREEGLEFLREYKEELGHLWEEAKEAFRDSLSGEDLEQQHSVRDYFQRIKEYFKNLGLKLKEAYHEFGEWVQEHTQKKMDGAKGHLERLRIISEEYVRNVKFLSKEVREQGLEFLREYKEQLGHLWKEAKEAFKETTSGRQESVSDAWHRIKEYFQDKYHKFAEWVKEHTQSKMDKFLSRLDTIKAIAEEYIQNVRFLTKEIREEGLEFLRQYKKELGGLWQEAKEAFERTLKHEEKRSLKDLWQDIRDYFKGLKLDIKEKYAKFGSWLKEHKDKALDKAKDKVESLKIIAKKYIEKVKTLKEDVLVEGHGYLQEYKDELGNIWEDVKVAFRDAYKNLKEKKE